MFWECSVRELTCVLRCLHCRCVCLCLFNVFKDDSPRTVSARRTNYRRNAVLSRVARELRHDMPRLVLQMCKHLSRLPGNSRDCCPLRTPRSRHLLWAIPTANISLTRNCELLHAAKALASSLSSPAAIQTETLNWAISKEMCMLYDMICVVNIMAATIHMQCYNQKNV